MARKRQNKACVRPTELFSKSAAGAHSAAQAAPTRTAQPTAIAFTLEQAQAELDRVTQWGRSLPICRALLTIEINRLRADGNAAVESPAAPEPSTTVTPKSPPVEIDACNDKKVTETATMPSPRLAAAVDPKHGADGQVAGSSPPPAEDPGVPDTPEHWEQVAEEDSPVITKDYADASQGEDTSSKIVPSAPQLTKAHVKIRIPVEEFPGYNFIGRLLGPRGATLKNLETSSKCRLFIRGRGSLRSTDMTHEQSKASLPGFEHLNEDLHVLVEYEGALSERDQCLSIARRLIQPLLVPPASDEQDELKKQQLKELAILNGTYKENKQLLPIANKRITPGVSAASNHITNTVASDVPLRNGNNGSGGLANNLLMQQMAQHMMLAQHHIGVGGGNSMDLEQQQHALNAVRLGNSQMLMQVLEAQQQFQQASRHQAFASSSSTATSLSSAQGFNTHVGNCGLHASAPSFTSSAAFSNNVAYQNRVASRGAGADALQNRGRTNPAAASCGHTNQFNGACEAEPFVPSAALEQQRGRSASLDERGRQFDPKRSASADYTSRGMKMQFQRSVSQERRPFGQHSMNQAHSSARMPDRSGALHHSLSFHDNENANPQRRMQGVGEGMLKAPSSPSFLTSMPLTPLSHKEAHASRSAASAMAAPSVDACPQGWERGLNFDLGWRSDKDFAINSSLSDQPSLPCHTSPSAVRRGAAHHFHPYSRSPPKDSPDFTSKVLSICSASFGSNGHVGVTGAYSLF